jgi:8-oxo-dGTP pyrophosphatase MutT (NUDIX family)
MIPVLDSHRGGGRTGRVSGKGRERRGRQCAALPFAWNEGEFRVLLVTSRETRRWVLPKGWMEKRLAPHALAAKEAFEEAGVMGAVERRCIGRYDYLKRGPRDRTTPCSVRVFPMRVERLLDDWPERRQRQRRWFSPAEAAMAVEEGGLVALLLRLAAPDAAASQHGNALEGGDQAGAHVSPGGFDEAHHRPGLVPEEAGAGEHGQAAGQRGDEDQGGERPEAGPQGPPGEPATALRQRPHLRHRRDT